MRGFYGIALYHMKNEVNYGSLLRTAMLLDCQFIAFIGRRFKQQASDTMKSFRHIPVFNYDTFDSFYAHMPHDTRLVGVELSEGAKSLKEFEHPGRAVYMFGAEDSGIPEKILDRCHDVVRLDGERSMNLAVAGSIVIYHRMCL